MVSTEPFGNLRKATILVIGHDPRLQKSQARAEKAFFFEYLEKYQDCPTFGPEARKYCLANAVWDYVNDLAGRHIDLDQLYVTNLCNEFLSSSQGKGTVLIPDDKAEAGVKEIDHTVLNGHFDLILPMSVQVFYHLVRLGFVDENSDMIHSFLCSARPRQSALEHNVYSTVGKAPFLEVAGKLFHHRGIPLVPIIHVKQWPLNDRFTHYIDPMESAKCEVGKVLSGTNS
jgi:hypothetical protein